MSDFLSTPGSLYGVDASEIDTNVRFAQNIHTMNPMGIQIKYNVVAKQINVTMIETKLVACKLQFLSLINKYGGICDISFTTSEQFINPGLLLMELRGCSVSDMELDIQEEGNMVAVYHLTVSSIYDVGDPAPWDPVPEDDEEYEDDVREENRKKVYENPDGTPKEAIGLSIDLSSGNAGTDTSNQLNSSADYDDSFVR
jgi:hypothetical protein